MCECVACLILCESEVMTINDRAKFNRDQTPEIIPNLTIPEKNN